ncbi:hypothetical protein IG631_20909 [Alternaria alternata]|nr:hypothetical protein IG631_20909 [Alternaria alternata]
MFKCSQLPRQTTNSHAVQEAQATSVVPSYILLQPPTLNTTSLFCYAKLLKTSNPPTPTSTSSPATTRAPISSHQQRRTLTLLSTMAIQTMSLV